MKLEFPSSLVDKYRNRSIDEVYPLDDSEDMETLHAIAGGMKLNDPLMKYTAESRSNAKPFEYVVEFYKSK